MYWKQEMLRGRVPSARVGCALFSPVNRPMDLLLQESEYICIVSCTLRSLKGGFRNKLGMYSLCHEIGQEQLSRSHKVFRVKGDERRWHCTSVYENSSSKCNLSEANVVWFRITFALSRTTQYNKTKMWKWMASFWWEIPWTMFIYHPSRGYNFSF